MTEAKKRGLAVLPQAKRVEIATKGGKAVSGNRAHMSEIGKKGAASRWSKYSEKQTLV